MKDYKHQIKQIKIRVNELKGYGINLPHFKDICHSNEPNIVEFLSNQYTLAFNKHFNSIEFLQHTKLIKKNPAANEHFTYKKEIDILKIMHLKTSKNQATMLNYINSFTQSLKAENLQFIFATQTIAPENRHQKDTNIKNNIITQKDILNQFHRNENKHYKFFKKNPKIDAKTGAKSDKREFIRALEFHLDFNLHEHTIKCFDDSLNHLINYIKLYEMNRKSNIGIGRCEIVLDIQYKADIIKYFNLKKYAAKDSSFYYNEELFDGKLKNGNQLCIKFFNHSGAQKLNTMKWSNTSKPLTLLDYQYQYTDINQCISDTQIQIAKYLVSYMNADFSKDKGSYKFIFNNMNIRNITHSQVLFSKTLFSKLYRHLNKYKSLQKYKDMYQFSKAHKDNNIQIEYIYNNTAFANGVKEDDLIELNQRFNESINYYKNINALKKYNRVKSHYNKFLKRYSQYFNNMAHSMEITFIKENRVLKVDLSVYASASTNIYKKLKNIDADIQLVEKELRSFAYIQENDLYGENTHKALKIQISANIEIINNIGADKQRINTLIEQDINLEKLEAAPLDKYARYNELIKVIESRLIQYKELDYNKFLEHNIDKLKYVLMEFEYATKSFRADIWKYEENYYYNLCDFKDFNSQYYV